MPHTLTMLSRFVPRAKSHSHPHLVSSGFTPSSLLGLPTYTDQSQSHPTRPQGSPVTSEVTAKTLVRMHLLGLGDMDAPRDHLAITSHRPLLGLLPGSVRPHRPGPMGLSQSHPKSWPEPWSECTPTALGYLLRSHGQHVTIAQPHVTHATCWQATSCGPGT